MRKNDVSFAMPLLLIYYEQYMNEIVYWLRLIKPSSKICTQKKKTN